jgi:hypothetical protein
VKGIGQRAKKREKGNRRPEEGVDNLNFKRKLIKTDYEFKRKLKKEFESSTAGQAGC